MTKAFKLIGLGTLLATIAAAAPAEATERTWMSHHACRSSSAPDLVSWPEYSRMNDNGLVYCPITRMTVETVFSDLDLRTSSGVEVGEVMLMEIDQDGDGGASYTPSTTVCGGGHHCHDWSDITPTQTDTYFLFYVEAQPNDKIYAYSVADSTLDFN
jgi:hypothetical protein